MPAPARNLTGRRLRYLLPICGALLLAASLTAVLWVLDHTRLRHDHFVERRGELQRAREEPIIREGRGYSSQAVRLEADTGLAVYLRVLRPTQAEGPLPLMVVLGGHRTGQDAVDLIGNPGNVVVAALDYPYHGPIGIYSLAEFIRALRLMQQGLLDTPPAVSLAMDWLSQQPWVDADHAELVGVSFGTPFVAVAGALDERFRRVWVIHGGAGNQRWIEHNLGARVESAFWRPSAAWLLHILAYGASFDTEYWIERIAPRPLVVIGATDDDRLPRDKVERLYAAAGEPRELIWTQGAHVDPRRPEIVQALLSIVRERMAAKAPDEDDAAGVAQAEHAGDPGDPGDPR
jgi:hypothetical protein